MEIQYCGSFVLFLLSVLCVTNSSVLSGLAGFGLRPLEHDVCDQNRTDPRTCYETVVTNISCLTAELKFDRCKKHEDTFLSNSTFSNNRPKNWTHLQAFYNRLDGGRHRQGDIGSCVEISQTNCTQYRCVKSCCAGWEMDEYGQCTKRTTSVCKNGGTYDWRFKQCMCTQGFSGQHCEIALCHRGCLHGGQCVATITGSNRCICLPHTTGSHCQILHCPQNCENGGYCISDGPSATCKCQPGFYGKTCSHSYQGDTLCPPPNSTICTDVDCKDDCERDNDCKYGQVCCTDGCCLKCVKKRSPGCWHNGILHQPLTIFRKDNCTECICQTDGSTKCLTVPLSYEECCFSYCRANKQQSQQSANKLPTINCSDEIKTVEVNAYSALASVKPLNIQARDQNGKSLEVFYTPTYVIHYRRPPRYRDVVSVRASAMDSWNNTVECYQKVSVVDHTKPRFRSCPSDIYAKEGELVSWREPTVSDNVGIRYLHSNYRPSSIFRPGLTIVMYTASDFDNMKSYCRFVIHITASRTDDTPPRFLSCPHNVYGTEGQLISWREPRAYDAHGIRSLVSTHKPNRVFPLGLTLVEYTATDFANKKGYCRFRVFITPRDTGIRDDQENSSSKSVTTNMVEIAASTISGLLVAVIVSAVICRGLRARQKHRARSRRERGPRVPIQTVSNAMYEGRICNSATVPTLKPPPYSPATDPPPYDEIFSFSNTGTRNEVENPPEYSRIEQ